LCLIADLKENKSGRMVVEVYDDLNREIRRLGLLNDLRIYRLASAIIEEFPNYREQIKGLD